MTERLTRTSPAKVNLLLNVLGRREDGFHELETLMVPVPVEDELTVTRGGVGLVLTCSRPELPTDSRNLVHRAATAFLQKAGIREGIELHLEKRVPLEAGLGGGSSNAATTLLLLNDLLGRPLDLAALAEVAAGLGSDVPFFLHSGPALATGRGERIQVLEPFDCLRGVYIFLSHPGFGVSTPWAYKQLAGFPSLLNGRAGRAGELIEVLRAGDLKRAGGLLYNALEGPVHMKYPLLIMFQEFLKARRPLGVLMSGSGSTTFSLWEDERQAREAERAFRAEFGDGSWTSVGPLA